MKLLFDLFDLFDLPKRDLFVIRTIFAKIVISSFCSVENTKQAICLDNIKL